ncbi:MAG: helix-turn-helix transcriptional regulator [Anaerolineae bacterium]|nr:helix-turn-helix transcriptional regulator [Anaerolineae bacterium]
MASMVETQGNTEVAQLLQQFLSNFEGNLVSQESLELDTGNEILLCVIQMAGVRYKLSYQPCPEASPIKLVLSPREKEVVRLVIKGFTTQGIAKVLDISPWTVTTHIRRVFSKLDVNSRAEMVACVLKDGVL